MPKRPVLLATSLFQGNILSISYFLGSLSKYHVWVMSSNILFFIGVIALLLSFLNPIVAVLFLRVILLFLIVCVHMSAGAHGDQRWQTPWSWSYR